MQDGPSPEERPGGPRANIACYDPPVQVTFRLLALILGVEVGRLVFLVEHPNDNPEERRNDRHARWQRLSALGPV